MNMENTKKLVSNDEIKKEKRRKNLATLKASNELLQQAMETVMNTDKLDNVTRTERVNDIKNAIEENKFKAKTALNASERELNEITYSEVSQEAKDSYKKRLEKLGKTEEDIERMAIAVVADDEQQKSSKRKHIMKKKRGNDEEVVFVDEPIVRLSNEEELMRSTMATDDMIRERMSKNTKQEDKLEKEVKESLEETKIKVVRKDKERPSAESDDKIKVVRKTSSAKNNSEERAVCYAFDFSSIPDYVQYDVIPLPSDGKCYPIDSPLRCGRVPVAYLTASDENIIASPNMYRDGKILDVILERKILDKRINIHDIVKGDRDAIILWLRSTGYGPNFPIVATDPVSGKKYDITVDLNKLKYKKFSLESDDDGNFEFRTSNDDVFKFNYMTQDMIDELRNNILLQNVNVERFDILKYLKNIEDCLGNIDNLDEDDKYDIKGCVNDIRSIITETDDNVVDTDEVFNKSITEQMILYTKSINGNEDKDYIRKYIENMRSNESYRYRTHINDNTPGVDMKITVNIPESDGGGSFDTFLKFGNDVFLVIQEL